MSRPAPVDDEAAQVQVQVVLERHPDSPVELHAVLQELGAVLADVGLGGADQLGCVAAALLDGGASRRADGIWPRASSSCRRTVLQAWYEASGRPKE